jgi:hypothetical protein
VFFIGVSYFMEISVYEKALQIMLLLSKESILRSEEKWIIKETDWVFSAHSFF